MTKQSRGMIPVILIILALTLIISGCAKKTPSASSTGAKLPISETYYVFDTVVTVKVYDEKVSKENFAKIGTILDNVEIWLNRENKDSEIYKVNEAAGKEAVKVSPETFKAVKAALQDSIDSNGVFDLTIGPIVSLWGIGQDGAHKPADADIAKALALVNYKEVTLDEPNLTVKLNKPGMSLDIGGTGKGYAADLIAEYLESQGFHSAIIDMGGNLLTVGQKPDGSDWTIGIQNPDQSRGTSVGTVKVGPMAIVASGIYERFFMEDGVRYHHIMDTDTGAPVQNELASVTILTDLSAMTGEGLDNWVFSLGLEKGLAYVDSREGVEAVFITKDQKVYVSKGLKGKMTMTDDSFTLAGE